MVDRNKMAIEVAKIKQEISKVDEQTKMLIPENVEKFAKELWELRYYKEDNEKQIAEINGRHGKENMLNNYAANLRRIIDIEHQIKTYNPKSEEKDGIWEPINKQCHDYITKPIQMVLAEAEDLKLRTKRDQEFMKENGITQKELDEVRENVLKGKEAYKSFFGGE